MKDLLIISLLGIALSSCGNGAEEPGNAIAVPSGNAVSSSCPFLTGDPKGNPVLSWVKGISDTDFVMCYAVSSDKGRSFGPAVEIPPSSTVSPHAENMPKIVFKPDGEIIALWGVKNPSPKNKYSGLVFYSQSFDEGRTWSGAHPLVKDSASIDERYFDVALLPNGEAGVIWLDNRKKTKKEGSTIYFASTNGKNGFENEAPFDETCCQCCRTELFVDSRSALHAAYRKIISDSIRDMVHAVSADGGTTFLPSVRISADNWAIKGCPHSGPTMIENKNGLHFAWYTMGGGSGVFYCRSADYGKTFSSRDSVSGRASAKHPQLAALENGDVIIVWDETIKKGTKFNNWIGLQRRAADGKVISRQYITPDEVVSEFPAIRTVDRGKVLVAYTQRIEKKEQVMCRVLEFR